MSTEKAQELIRARQVQRLLRSIFLQFSAVDKCFQSFVDENHLFLFLVFTPQVSAGQKQILILLDFLLVTWFFSNVMKKSDYYILSCILKLSKAAQGARFSCVYASSSNLIEGCKKDFICPLKSYTGLCASKHKTNLLSS